MKLIELIKSKEILTDVEGLILDVKMKKMNKGY